MNNVVLQMENTGKFLQACEKYGVKKADLFQSVDLFENQNMDAVIKGIVALGRMVSELSISAMKSHLKSLFGWSFERTISLMGVLFYDLS